MSRRIAIAGCVIAALTLAGRAQAQSRSQFQELHALASVATGPPSEISQAADGAYLVTVHATAEFHAFIVRVTANGDMSLFHDFTDAEGSPAGHLLPNPDGSFYGVSTYPGTSGVFRLDASGAFSLDALWTPRTDGRLVRSANGTTYGWFSQSFFTISPQGVVTQLAFSVPASTFAFTVGPDGTVYGVRAFSTFSDIYQRVPDGTITSLFTFLPVEQFSSPVEIERADDGTLFGMASNSGYGVPSQCSIYSWNTSGFAVLKTFPTTCNRQVANVFQGADGNIYGRLNGDIFQLTFDGTYTLLHHLDPIAGEGSHVNDLIQAADGSLVGTTDNGGEFGGGSVFRLTTAGTFSVIASLPAGNVEGVQPIGNLVAIDQDFYGATQFGGVFNEGVIFRVSRTGTYVPIYTFTGGSDGGQPQGLVKGPDGALYGTTRDTGTPGVHNGTFFRITPSGTLTTLHVFQRLIEGYSPGPLMLGRDGYFYGWTSAGGANRQGTVFRLSPTGDFSGLHVFGREDGVNGLILHAAFVQGADGSLYTTTGDSKVVRVTVRGDVAVLSALSASAVIAGRDGQIYGVSDGAAAYVFAVDVSGAVRTFPLTGALATGYSIRLKGQTADGTFFGTAILSNGISSGFNGVVFRWTAATGASVLLGLFPGAEGYYGGTTSALVDGEDGFLYGTTIGSVFRLSSTPTIPIDDFTGSGRSSVAVYRPSTSTWLVRDTQGTVAGYQWGQPGDIPVPADYDGDGVIDLAVLRRQIGSTAREWFIATSSSHFTQAFAVFLGSDNDIPVPGDYDGDGKADPATFNPATGRWTIKLGESIILTQFGEPGDVPVPGDYDGTGHAQLAVYRRGTWFIKGQAGVETIDFGMPGDVPVPSDFMGTGRVQLAVYRPSTSDWFVQNQFAVRFGAVGDWPVPLDLDGDGRAEVVVYRPSTGEWASYVPSTGSISSVSWGLAGDIPAAAARFARRVPGDIDGDRRAELTIFRPSDGNWWSARSSTDYQASVVSAWGTTGDVPLMGDFLGTHRDQRTVFRDGVWWIQGADAPISFGMAGDVPVPADYDGDGVTDLAVFRDGLWIVRRSSDPSGPLSVFGWGGPGDVPGTGDFDGDGRADLAICRDGVWYVAYGANYFGQISFAGIPGDIGATADFDGDGRTDLALFRPSDGTWRIQRSADGVIVTAAFGRSGDVPVPADYERRRSRRHRWSIGRATARGTCRASSPSCSAPAVICRSTQDPEHLSLPTAKSASRHDRNVARRAEADDAARAGEPD